MLWLIPLLGSFAVCANAQNQNRASYVYNFTPLSPLFTYYNSPGNDADWNLTRAGAYSNTPGSSFELNFYGTEIRLGGSGQNASGDDPRGDQQLEASSYPRFRVTPTYTSIVNGTETQIRDTVLEMMGSSWIQDEYRINIRVDEVDWAFINMTGGYAMLTIPADFRPGEPRETTIIPAINSDNTTSDHFSEDSASAWSTTTPTYNNTGGRTVIPFAGREGVAPYGPSMLSTTTVGAPLRIRVPSLSSVMLIHGPITPDQGRYSVELVNRTAMLDYPHRMMYEYNAARPISALDELKVAAHMDPRVEYDALIRLTEEGKRADIQGATFTTYVHDKNITEWWNDPRTPWNRPNLDSGQITGIVIGSVVGGVILLLGIVLWLRGRRNRRNKAGAKHDVATLAYKSAETETIGSRV